MRALNFLALFAAGLTAIAAVGCGSDSDTTSTGGTAGTGGTGTGGATGGGGTGGMATTTTTSTGGTTVMGDGNDSFEEAVEIAVLHIGLHIGTQASVLAGDFVRADFAGDLRHHAEWNVSDGCVSRA